MKFDLCRGKASGLLRSLVAVALCGLCPGLAVAGQAAVEALVFCHEDQDAYPWVMTDRTGLNLQLLGLVAETLALTFTYVPVPWKRCLSGLEQGLYDGAFASSFKIERLSAGHYPLASDGQPDVNRRLHMSRYALYRRRGEAVTWDGSAFRHLHGRIGSLSGFSIVGFLREQGVEVDETSRDPLAMLRMLDRGRIEAAALQSQRADFVLQANPPLAQRIEKVESLLEEKPYYLMLSKALVAHDPALAQSIWDEIAWQRESPTYQQRMRLFLQGSDAAARVP
ncbi:substrate-binding periplasmic protein [Pseudomonas zhanjiangensis]|uniref:Substrate-binding periplasmic protein n=1 Tax=Pseudomonas zhanjiangensis TaxID=3239015 RepID=A0ABV3YPN3_9PSED